MTLENGSIAELLEAGRYDWKNNDITDEHFPQQQEKSSREIEIELLHFSRHMTTKSVTHELYEQGFRPAFVSELLAFGAAHPDVQRWFPVVALGDQWRSSLGYLGFVYLYRLRDDKRDADIYWDDGDWGSHCRFAAVRLH